MMGLTQGRELLLAGAAPLSTAICTPNQPTVCPSAIHPPQTPGAGDPNDHKTEFVLEAGTNMMKTLQVCRGGR
jgi:hypothetical protein